MLILLPISGILTLFKTTSWIFKTHLLLPFSSTNWAEILKARPKYYNAGARKGQVLHAMLRLECSSLNSDLYRKHIVPSLTCQCDVFESTANVLFICQMFTNMRLRYLPGNLGKDHWHLLWVNAYGFSKYESLPTVLFFTVNLPWIEYFMNVKSIYILNAPKT